MNIKELLSIEKLNLPEHPPVRSIESYEFTDSIGDRAIRVLVVLASDIPETQREWKDVEPIRDRIASRLKDNDIDLYPYVRFVTEDELQGMKAA